MIVGWSRSSSRPTRWPAIALLAAVVLIVNSGCTAEAPPEVLARHQRFDEVTMLPPPMVDRTLSLETLSPETLSLEEALAGRRSGRAFAATTVDDTALGQLLWAGQGVTDEEGHRTAPSAGALYPIELYVVTAGSVFHYLPDTHALEGRAAVGTRQALAEAAFGQSFVGDAPVVLVVAAVPARTAAKYGGVANALVDKEAGHVAQNVLLQATALGLVATPVGGFDPNEVAELLALPPGWDVRYLIPVGHRP